MSPATLTFQKRQAYERRSHNHSTMGQNLSKGEARMEARRPFPAQTNVSPSVRSPVTDRPITPTESEMQPPLFQTQDTKTVKSNPPTALNRASNLDIPSPSASLDTHISPDGNTIVGTEGEHRMNYSQSWASKNQHINEQRPFEPRLFRDKTSLKITSSSLIKILKDVTLDSLASYQHEELFYPQTSINEPYHLIFYHWEKLEKHSHEDVKDLLGFVKENCQSTYEKCQELQLRTCTEISFEDLWLLYYRGTTILSKDDNGWRAYKVERVEHQSYSNSGSMLIYAHYLDFDSSGQWLVPHLEVLTVHWYPGDRVIGNLEVIPEWYFQKQRNNNLLGNLVQRGKAYESYRGKVYYRDYNGDIWPRTPRKDLVKVLIDYVTSSRHIADTNILTQSHYRSVCSICLGDDMKLPSFPKNAPHDPILCTRGSSSVSSPADEHENEEANPWLYCPSGLWAFSLKHKTWRKIPPLDLSIVTENDKAFKWLWMNDGHRRDLDTMVSAYKNSRLKISNPDVVNGKGRGFNILLQGGPGTGKSMTVESLSEKHGCPLYTVTCGDLGAEPELLEQRLHEIFLRASNWKSIVLLHDVDIILEARASDLRRNIIASIFLCQLEYSDGFLFMTTNRPKKLDQALGSRIHMHISFKDFDIFAQKWVWNNFIEEVCDLPDKEKKQLQSFVSSGDLEQCGWPNMNGRQIRNCMSAALALSQAEGCNLNPDHIKKMLSHGKEFMEFMSNNSWQVQDNRSGLPRNLVGMIPKQVP